jgi:hypothetical protein
MENLKINFSGFIAYLNRPKNMMLENMRDITRTKRWKDECEALLKKKFFSSKFIEAFHTHWVESAHHIRSQVGNDARLIEMLRHILPRYKGKDVLLYRGENIDRFRTNSTGFCWTQDINVARMFAQGLNAVNAGGVLLSCICKKDWIIATPNVHSNYLGEEEYIVDVLKVSNIEAKETFKSLEIIQ